MKSKCLHGKLGARAPRGVSGRRSRVLASRSQDGRSSQQTRFSSGNRSDIAAEDSASARSADAAGQDLEMLTVNLPTGNPCPRRDRTGEALESGNGRRTPAARRLTYNRHKSDSLSFAVRCSIEILPLVLLVLLSRGTTALSSEGRNANAVRSSDRDTYIHIPSGKELKCVPPASHPGKN